MSEPFARTPEPPYYAVVFTTLRTPDDPDGYAETAARMEELAARQPGYLGVESVRGADGVGITVSYWASLEAVRAWAAVAAPTTLKTIPSTRPHPRPRRRVCRYARPAGTEGRVPICPTSPSAATPRIALVPRTTQRIWPRNPAATPTTTARSPAAVAPSDGINHSSRGMAHRPAMTSQISVRISAAASAASVTATPTS